MGDIAQKRFFRKRDLELFLSQIEPNKSPKVDLEQYTITPSVAGTILYLAAYANNDILGKRIIELGCGTGRLAIGAALLGAAFVVGVDIDASTIHTASANSEKIMPETDVQWIIGDIDTIQGKFDTVLQNPPFGVQKPSADRKFLKKALEIGDVIYSLHNHPWTDKMLLQKLRTNRGALFQIAPSDFLNQFVEINGGLVKAVYPMKMTIPHMFGFHKKAKYDFIVDLYVIQKSH